MAHWSKTFRRYERHMLLGLVILLLIIFSVTGALTPSSQGGASTLQLGGSFKPPTGPRVELSDLEMQERLARWDAFFRSVGLPTLDYATHLIGAPGYLRFHALWMHTMLSETARQAGFRCGEDQKRKAVRTALVSNQRMGMLQVTPESYERFLTELYLRPASEFELTLSEIVAKDELLSTLIDPVRYSLTYAEAYERWKASRERVDLRYLAAEAQGFREDVAREERTQLRIHVPEEALRKVGETLRGLRFVQQRLDAHKAKHGAFPESLAVLTAKDADKSFALEAGQAKDAWGREFVYVRGETGVTLSSPGLDGAAGTADDVLPAQQDELETHQALAKVADALVRWREGGAPKAWPGTLEELLKPPARAAPKEGEPPPPPAFAALTHLPKDGWDRELVYRPAADAPPGLFSAGADGQPGTADDIAASVREGRARVEPGGSFQALAPPAGDDAWGRPITVYLSAAQAGAWVAHSAGPDGEVGTADDIVGSNRGLLQAFYARADVKSEFAQPARRRFKALVMHLPFVSDETLRRLWADFPDERPVSKEDAQRLFDRWRAARGNGEEFEFQEGDPRDPENGHGAALAKKLLPEATPTLVPAASVFEVAGGAPPAPAEPADAPDPLRTEYETKGWREILLRQEFVERVVNKFWQQVVTSKRAVAEWEKKGEKVTPRPEELKLEDVLDDERLGKYMPGEAERARGVRFLEFYETPAPLTTKEILDLPHLGDMNFVVHLGQLKVGEVSSIPVPVNKRLTKVLLESVESTQERVPDLEEVEDQVFERYLDGRSLERAERELAAFQRDVQKRQAERKEGETDEAIWQAALKAWREARPGVTVHDERTGLFIGGRVPPRGKPPADADAATKAAIARRGFVRQAGYGLVRAGDSKQDLTDSSPGSFGRHGVRDDSRGENATGCAYLVRVAERVYPSKSEFSPRAYAEHLAEHVFGELRTGSRAMRRAQVSTRRGELPGAVSMWLDELAHMQQAFDLRTNANLDQLGLREQGR
jgi:hypothetical protein